MTPTPLGHVLLWTALWAAMWAVLAGCLWLGLHHTTAAAWTGLVLAAAGARAGWVGLR